MLFASAAASYATSHHLRGLTGAALIHGYTPAFWWAAGIFAVGLIVALVVLPRNVAAHPAVAPVKAPAEASLATE